MAPTATRQAGAVATVSASATGSGAFVRPEIATDWEPYKDAITELYKTLKLRDVMVQMETGHAFKAT